LVKWPGVPSSAIIVESRSVFPAMPDGSATAHHYRPKLATVLAEGYNLGHFRKDMLAALTVAIVALALGSCTTGVAAAC